MVGSSLGMDIAELKRLVELYDLETYLFETVSKEFEQKRTLTTFESFAIITWKSNRSKTKVRDGLVAAGKSASDVMRDVSRAEKTEAKVETLLRIGGDRSAYRICYLGRLLPG